MKQWEFSYLTNFDNELGNNHIFHIFILWLGIEFHVNVWL